MKEIAIRLFLQYLCLAAKIQLAKINPKHIIGVTGSAGKSSCRDAVYAILKERFKVKSGKKSMNSDVGIPLDILGFTESYSDLDRFYLKVAMLTPLKLLFSWPKYDAYVVEMGVDRPGDMDFLLSIVRPSVGVFLNALPVHTANFPGENEEEKVAAIAKEKGKLILGLKGGGVAVLNGDDPRVNEFKQIAVSRQRSVITFGREADVKLLLVDLPGFLLTEDYGYTLAAAVAVGKALGISESEARESLRKNFQLPPGRMSVFKGIKNTTIIDSSYNASPKPMISCLKTLATCKLKANSSKLRTIAVLGDMRELGLLEKEEHEKVAEEAAKDADFIFIFGPLMEKFFAPRARKFLKGNNKVIPFRVMVQLIDHVINFLREGDVVLVKGSQNTIMLETVVEKLLVDPKDVEKLCRRGEFWEKKRRALLNS